MKKNILLTILSTIVGIGLASSPLKKYPVFNQIMEFLGSGGAF
jgi:hypothetical protein